MALVDDEASVRQVLADTLSARDGFEVVGEAGDGASAIALVEQRQPDVVVLDLGLPDLSGLDVIPRIRFVAPEARVVVFTGRLDEDLERQATTAGVRGFALKGQDLEYLLDLLERVGGEATHAAVIELSPRTLSAQEARQFVHDQCEHWGCRELVDTAMLVVSELVTNAVVHAATPAELRAEWADGVLRLEVLDHAEASPPDPRIASPDDEGGRGLFLVDALSAAWGVEPSESGKVVWAEVTAPA